MLQIKPNCECCGKSLPNESSDAKICSFECTYCKECAEGILENVCPNCGGGLEKRPTRPSYLLVKYPVSNEVIVAQYDKEKHQEKLNRFKDIEPSMR